MRKLFAIFTTRSLRVDIITAFGGLLLITVLVVIFYFYHNSSRIVLMLCDDPMEQSTQNVINRSVGFLQPEAAMTEMSSQVTGANLLPFSKVGRFEPS